MTRKLDVSGVAVEPSALAELNWNALFGNDRPIEIEIGVGKGAFLLRRSQARPDLNFLGIEWAGEFFRFAADRMRRWDLTNVRMIRADASHFIRLQCPRASLRMIHVYHPDPWPKKRHHKRRLFQQPFVDAAAECLLPGGRLAVQTDHAEYHEIIRGLLLNNPRFREIPFEILDFARESGELETNFEIKYRREGRDFFRLAVERTETQSIL